MVAPAAFAAEDDLGMRYTSASEGLYMSIRTEFATRDNRYAGDDQEDESAALLDGGSRWGIQGSNDLGNGLEGFYRYESSLGQDNSQPNGNTRLRYVGLRGAFGDARAGTIWDDTYNYVTSKSDMSPNDSGRFAWRFRVNNALQYNTPDLNGFQAGFRIVMNPEADNSAGARGVGTPASTSTSSVAQLLAVKLDTQQVAPLAALEATDNQFDNVALVGKYSVAGFNIAGAYERQVDGLAAASYYNDIANTNLDVTAAAGATAITTLNRDDLDRWAVGASYAQDNWYVGGWYGEQEQRNVVDASGATVSGNRVTRTGNDFKAGQDFNKEVETISLGGSVDVDKVTVFATWEQVDNNFNGTGYYEDSGANVGVIYRLGAKSRVWVEYVSEDNDNDESQEDAVLVGLRHDF